MKSAPILVVFTLLLFTISLNAQVYSDKVIDEERVSQLEEEMKKEYPYAFPIFGKRVIEKGYDIPYSAGVSLQYLTQESDVLISDLQVGFNNGDPFDLDPYVRFPRAVSRSYGVNFRPDVWLFPFLNVYGVFATSSTSTEVDVTLNLPNQDGFEDITTFNTELSFDAVTTGIGVVPTVGIAGAWFAVDFNFTWTDTGAIDKPVYAFVLGPRLGKSFQLKKPERNIAVWVGGFRVQIDRTTSGSIPFSDIFDDEEEGALEAKINTGLEAVDQKLNEVEDWFESLSPRDQILNRPRYEVLTRTLTAANSFLVRLDEARINALDSTLQYDIEKRQKNLWNFIVGAQYQHNKHWMFRAEVGFLGSRTQFVGGLQYRFRL